MSKTHGPQLGRLAFRREGDNVNAYWAQTETMAEAMLLGSISVVICDRQVGIFDRFKDLMRDVMSEATFQATGVRPVWDGEHKAPEHERSGRA
jgi:hypothetical protein